MNACGLRGRRECASYLEHVVDGLLLRVELRELRADGCDVVLAGEALVELEISVHDDWQTAPFQAQFFGSLGVRGLHNARLQLVGGQGRDMSMSTDTTPTLHYFDVSGRGELTKVPMDTADIQGLGLALTPGAPPLPPQ